MNRSFLITALLVSVPGLALAQPPTTNAATAPPAVVTPKTPAPRLQQKIDHYISGLYAQAAANPSGPQQIFKSAPGKTNIDTTPVKIAAFDTAGAKVTGPQFAGTATVAQTVHFNGGNAYFTKNGQHLWFNTDGNGGFGKAGSGLWYGPIPTGK